MGRKNLWTCEFALHLRKVVYVECVNGALLTEVLRKWIGVLKYEFMTLSLGPVFKHLTLRSVADYSCHFIHLPSSSLDCTWRYKLFRVRSVTDKTVTVLAWLTLILHVVCVCAGRYSCQGRSLWVQPSADPTAVKAIVELSVGSNGAIPWWESPSIVYTEGMSPHLF